MNTMLAVPTTTVSIYRGTSTNTFGDPVDDNTAGALVASGITASILTGPNSSQRPVDGTPRVVQYKTCRLPAGTDIRTDDRIKDEHTDQIYTFDSSTQPENIVSTQDIILKLRRVT